MTTVEWIDNVLSWVPNGTDWMLDPVFTGPTDSQVINTPVVTLAVAETPFAHWPQLESLVQDGRYSYAGAQARAAADLEAFSDPLVTAEWVTEDLAALARPVAGDRDDERHRRPGRQSHGHDSPRRAHVSVAHGAAQARLHGRRAQTVDVSGPRRHECRLRES